LNKELEPGAQALGVKLQMLRAHASEIDKAFLAMTEAQADALLLWGTRSTTAPISYYPARGES
jgi:hypothetical protein